MSNYRNPNRRLRIVKEEDYYFMVEIPNLEHVNTFYMTERDNLKDLFKIEYTLEVQEKSFLHVGNGLVKFLENGGKDENRIDSKFKKKRDGKTGLDFMRDEGGNPIIPGSSLKGHTRNNFEVLVPGSCFVSNRRGGGAPKKCKLPRRYHSITEIQLCPSCDLFGINRIMSRVMFSDARLIGKYQEKLIKIPRLMNPRKNKYISGCKKVYRKVKYSEVPNEEKRDYIWVVEPGARFKGHIDLFNSNFKELKQLYYAFANYHGMGRLLLGHGKNIGLGKCKVTEASIFMQKTPFSKEKVYKLKDPQDMRRNSLLRESKMREKGVKLRFELLKTIHQHEEGFPYPGLENYY